MDIISLPKDIKMEILLSLSDSDIGLLCLADRQFHTICQSTDFWKKRGIVIFGKEFEEYKKKHKNVKEKELYQKVLKLDRLRKKFPEYFRKMSVVETEENMLSIGIEEKNDTVFAYMLRNELVESSFKLDYGQRSILHWVSAEKMPKTLDALLQISNDAKFINQKSYEGETALDVAVKFQCKECVEILRKHPLVKSSK